MHKDLKNSLYILCNNLANSFVSISVMKMCKLLKEILKINDLKNICFENSILQKLKIKY